MLQVLSVEKCHTGLTSNRGTISPDEVLAAQIAASLKRPNKVKLLFLRIKLAITQTTVTHYSVL